MLLFSSTQWGFNDRAKLKQIVDGNGIQRIIDELELTVLTRQISQTNDHSPFLSFLEDLLTPSCGGFQHLIQEELDTQTLYRYYFSCLLFILARR